MSQPPYVTPVSPNPELPAGLTLIQFLQTVVVGLTALPGQLVRPLWQPEPPKQPDINVDWLAFGIDQSAPDFSAYLVPSAGGGPIQTQRQEDLTVKFSIYGPNCTDTYGLLRDGFQIPQNRFALFKANIGYTEITPGRHIPDLVNQRWVDRVECNVILKRQVQRTYPVLTFTSATGIIYVPDVSPDYQLRWSVPNQ